MSNQFEKTVRDYNDALEEPLKSIIHQIAVNNDGNSDHRRAQATLKLHLVKDQVAALNRLSQAMDENSKANESSGRKMFWLTLAIFVASALQAITPFFQR